MRLNFTYIISTYSSIFINGSKHNLPTSIDGVLISNPKNYKTDLTHHQLIGLKYIDDLNKSIPRSVIEEVEQFLNTFDFICMICGSYRRGKSESGDIDILIQDNGIDLKFIIDLLTKKKFLIDHLTLLIY